MISVSWVGGELNREELLNCSLESIITQVMDKTVGDVYKQETHDELRNAIKHVN